MRLVALVVGSLALSSVGFAAPRKSIGNTDTLTAQRIIKARLIDPYSVRFEMKQSVTGKDRGGNSVRLTCGSYNARNRMGGYVGAIGFVYVPSEQAVFTSNIERLSQNGSALTAEDLVTQAKRMSDVNEMMAQKPKLDALSEDVKYWLIQCEPA